MRGAEEEDEVGESSLGRLLAGECEGEEAAAFLAATSASNWAAERRLRPGICEEGGSELGGVEVRMVMSSWAVCGVANGRLRIGLK